MYIRLSKHSQDACCLLDTGLSHMGDMDKTSFIA